MFDRIKSDETFLTIGLEGLDFWCNVNSFGNLVCIFYEANNSEYANYNPILCLLYPKVKCKLQFSNALMADFHQSNRK